MLVFIFANFVPWVGYKLRTNIQITGVETNPFLNRYGGIVSQLCVDLQVVNEFAVLAAC